ncbi:MAG: sensor histidine kinase [Sandaracinaceae bacterium]
MRSQRERESKMTSDSDSDSDSDSESDSESESESDSDSDSDSAAARSRCASPPPVVPTPVASAVPRPALAPERALPREAMWFFVAAPPVLALLFDPECVKDADHVVRAWGAITAYTVITGIGVHYGFEWLAAKLAGRSGLVRLPAHLLLTCAIVSVLTAAQLPFVFFLYPEASDAALGILGRGILVSVIYLGLASFVAHLQRAAVRERLRAHQERTAALEARLAALRAQMQPHFLFNSLNVCAGLVHEDPDAAESTLDRLAGFLRYTLESTEKRLVSLDDELDALACYLEVQRSRFGDRLAFEIDASDDARASTLPPMLLQPLVENALLHGLADREKGGHVRIEARVDDGTLEIVVDDDGVGPDRSTHAGTGTGQRNVRERLALTYGPRATLEVGASSPGGYRCTIRIPR